MNRRWALHSFLLLILLIGRNWTCLKLLVASGWNRPGPGSGANSPSSAARRT